MDHDIAKLVIDGATCVAAGILAFVTWQLVRVTRHHAHFAKKMAASADRLGEILDRQAEALKEAAELHALVSAMAALNINMSQRGAHRDALESLVNSLAERRKRP